MELSGVRTSCRLLLTGRKEQGAEVFGGVEGHGHGGLPGEDEAVGRGSCAAEEADAQRLTWSRWAAVDC